MKSANENFEKGAQTQYTLNIFDILTVIEHDLRNDHLLKMRPNYCGDALEGACLHLW